MTHALKISLFQMNPTVGDVTANSAKILLARDKAAAVGSDLIVATEFAIAGYPPEDLVLKPAFCDRAEAAIQDLAKATADGGPAMIVGGPRRENGKLYNALYLLADGKIVDWRDKYHRPNYGVFDEVRVFAQGALKGPIPFKGFNLGLMVCEDIWFSDVTNYACQNGADVIIAPHGSPFEADKIGQRRGIAQARVQETGLPLALLNQVGGQDELVFDGTSIVVNGNGEVVHQMASFAEDLVHLSLEKTDRGARFAGGKGVHAPAEEEKLYNALILGLRDYVRKNGFPGVLIGMSGGVDSAFTAAVAVDALGADKVHLVMMPSRYTSSDSLEDARLCAEALGAHYQSIAIEPMVAAFDVAMKGPFKDKQADTTEENLQARIRGNILMALSNKFGEMVVATGNKSEMSVGYSTLYGDLCGGFALLKDVYKTKVYDLCRWRNNHVPSLALGPSGEVIPLRIITKAPTAELRDNQTDQDSLPPYDELDAILHGLIEEELSVNELISRGFLRETVARVEHMLYIAEYKRRQAPPGVKISRKQFGRDRRYPITNRFRDARRDPK